MGDAAGVSVAVAWVAEHVAVIGRLELGWRRPRPQSPCGGDEGGAAVDAAEHDEAAEKGGTVCGASWKSAAAAAAKKVVVTVIRPLMWRWQ